MNEYSEVSGRAYSAALPLSSRRSLYNFTFPYHNIDEIVLRLLKLEATGTLLDVGCGTGKLLHAVTGRFSDVSCVGLDSSQEMLSVAAAGSPASARVNWLLGSAESLPFPTRSFDRVSAIHMLYHVPDIGRAFHELSRVVTTNGTVVVTMNSSTTKPLIKEIVGAITAQCRPLTLSQTTERFNLENANQFFEASFAHSSIHRFDSTVVLSEIEPYVDYVDSTRGMWLPIPTDSVWQDALQIARDVLSSRLHSNGTLIDPNCFGAIVLTKSLYGRGKG
jgi:ubiquinone/menaquinone biosynthesis C-methylase UbiE